ncbi:MAG: hypothetical protein HC811_07050 [Flammeovirgaceae bacterium]|nr:hypothetical protein [Flammeovirgaceae bacterium]
MNTKIYLLAMFVFLLASCGKTTESANNDDMNGNEEDSSNQALYEKVMDIHDEVMPQMNDIYKLKKQLQEEITNSKDMVEDRKKRLESLVFTLDSANNAMMDWMRKFEPPDTLSVEDARAYLEDQMEKINGVKSAMLEAIEKAKQESDN